MFLEARNTTFLNILNNPSHLEVTFHSIQIIVIMSSVVISDVGIKRADCTPKTGFLMMLTCKRTD